MENNKQDEILDEKNKSKWKQWVKRFGIGGIIFFSVKGTITSLLIYFLGKNFWNVISTYFSAIFD